MSHKFSPTAASHKKKNTSRRLHKKIRNIALAAGGILLLFLAVFFSVSKSAPQNVVPAKIGVALGDFTLTDIHGATVHLSDFSGKTVLVNAWATWCPPCKAEMPLLNQYYQAHAKDGFVLLAVNAGDSLDLTASFANQYRLAFPVLLDPGTQLLGQMGIFDFPTSILIGKDGRIKTIHVGGFTTQSIETEITPLLGK